MLFDQANLTYWIFLAIGVVLFLFVIISGGGEDQDFDADTDVDFDADADIDGDADVEGSLTTLETDTNVSGDSPPQWLMTLSWLGLGKCPLLILLAIDFSTWGVSGWFLNVALGGFLGTIPSGFFAFLIFILSFGFSIWVGKVLSSPIGQIFSNSSEDVEGDRLVGCSGQVTSKQVPYIIDGRIAQADVLDSASNLVTVEVCLPEWAKVVPFRGQEILIIEKRQNYYIAIAKDSSDQDKWLRGA